jgi:hypothetical protein
MIYFIKQEKLRQSNRRWWWRNFYLTFASRRSVTTESGEHNLDFRSHKNHTFIKSIYVCLLFLPSCDEFSPSLRNTIYCSSRCWWHLGTWTLFQNSKWFPKMVVFEIEVRLFQNAFLHLFLFCYSKNFIEIKIQNGAEIQNCFHKHK